MPHFYSDKTLHFVNKQKSLFKRSLKTTMMKKPLESLSIIALACLSTYQPTLAGPKIDIAGLKKPAWVDHTDDKTLKILAQNDHDLFFLWGYYHAADRFFQMDVSRRQIQGELAALVGEAALPEDFRNRMLGVKMASERTWDILDDNAKKALTAYSNGVNAYLALGELPQEYSTLNLNRAQPWTPQDSIAIMKGVVIHLSLRLDVGRTEKLQQYIVTGLEEGFNGEALFFQDTHPIRPITANATYATAGVEAPYGRLFQSSNLKTSYSTPSHFQANAQAPEKIDNSELMSALDNLEDSLQRSSLWATLLAADEQPHIGSNWWAISAKHSDSGGPIIAGDPHLGTPWPGIFYDVHLRVSKDPNNGPLHAAGASFPGVPAIAHGQNESLIWVSTNNALDASDVFLDAIISNPNSSSDALEADAAERNTSTNSPTDTQSKAPTCDAPSGLCVLSNDQLYPVVMIPQNYEVNTSNPNNPNRIIPIDPPAEFAKIAQVPFRTYGPILKMIRPPKAEQEGKALVLQYTGLAASKEIMSFLHWMRSDNIAQFRQGLSDFEVGSQNWLVSDTRGDLAYFSSAKLPLREDLEKGTPKGYGPAFIREGTGGANWLPAKNGNSTSSTGSTSTGNYRALPFSEMPQIVNPPSGILVNANNDPTGQTLDGNLFNQTRVNSTSAIFYLNHGYADGLRAQRITDSIYSAMQNKRKRLSLEQVRDIQRDTFQQDAVYLLPRLITAYKNTCEDSSNSIIEDELKSMCDYPFLKTAFMALKDWDYSTRTGVEWASAKLFEDQQVQRHSQAATYYHLWRAHLIRSLIYAPLNDLALPEPSARVALRALIQHINREEFSCFGASGLDFCGQSSETLPPEQRRDYALLSALIDVNETLESAEYKAHLTNTGLNAWVWGALHRRKFNHILADQTQAAYGLPGQQHLSRFLTWGGIPAAGGYEVVDASPVPADAIELDALITHHGPARRVVGGLKKRWFKRSMMRSEAVMPTARRAQTQPEKMYRHWQINDQQPVFNSETFMRMRWEKHLPSGGKG